MSKGTKSRCAVPRQANRSVLVVVPQPRRHDVRPFRVRGMSGDPVSMRPGTFASTAAHNHLNQFAGRGVCMVTFLFLCSRAV